MQAVLWHRQNLVQGQNLAQRVGWLEKELEEARALAEARKVPFVLNKTQLLSAVYAKTGGTAQADGTLVCSL
jgi:hypothetical protein